MPTLFDYLNSINETKVDMSEGETFSSDYPIYMINRGIAQGKDGIFVAQELNKIPDLSKEMHYKFLFHFMDKKVRRNKWSKKAVLDKNVENVANYYKVSNEQAIEYIKMLTNEQLAIIENSFNFDPLKKQK